MTAISLMDQVDKTSLRVGYGDTEIVIRESHFVLRQTEEGSGRRALIVIEKDQWQSFLKMVDLANRISQENSQ
ncbi:hypothetical protein [Stutzerimonas nitrititolerans]|uniref:hypothetical protein n=1 Tax=Stutzerimonas nitrititolerans TaxID=2482751 RepID=UPI0028AF0E08|nr:hypothetical protein [Stutzerimonas nitrititolerans]